MHVLNRPIEWSRLNPLHQNFPNEADESAGCIVRTVWLAIRVLVLRCMHVTTVAQCHFVAMPSCLLQKWTSFLLSITILDPKWWFQNCKSCSNLAANPATPGTVKLLVYLTVIVISCSLTLTTWTWCVWLNCRNLNMPNWLVTCYY